MTTIVLPDIDSIERLDFTPELPCEFDGCEPEPKPATHRYVGTTWCGCRHHYLVCDSHTSRVRRWLHLVGTVYCTICGATRPHSRLCDWMRLEPLS